MSKIAKTAQRVWKSAQLYIGFHTDQNGNVREHPKVWPPKNGKASIHPDEGKQEVFLQLAADDKTHGRDVQIKLRPDQIVVRRDEGFAWEGIIVREDEIAVRVNGVRIRIKHDGSISHEDAGATTYIEGDGAVLKKTEFVDALMSGDGVELSRRTDDSIAAITEDGVIAKARDQDDDP
ncbi:hypothetical protein [Loktanella sp. Alg231-35]|uniref:hypothetical protein n=1 Tax=Loktanella sp. Alg231-35 TaxID=1922220 RepID=UPI000D55C163|nr:hypothetical protein [Loktanella sp. Alg231-35]